MTRWLTSQQLEQTEHKPSRLRVLASCQVYTPPSLAAAMVTALEGEGEAKWLEPCVGSGALLTALAKSGVTKEQITGLDLEERAEPNDKLARVYRGVEFLRWSLTTGERFDRIVANPPFIALERVQKRVLDAASRLTTPDQRPIRASGNIWCAFLCAAITLLRPNGSLCFLLPASWDFANYAEPLRQNIGRLFSRVDVHRSAVPLFRSQQVQDGSVVLVAHALRQRIAREADVVPTKRYEYADLTSLVKGLSKHSSLRKTGTNCPTKPIAIKVPTDTVALGDVMSISLGGVTGDARYFLLTEKRRLELGLPLSCLRPALTRARQLVSHEMNWGTWDKLKNENERIWLFHPTPSILKHRAVASYIQAGEHEGGCQIENHKVAIRSPWYRTPLPRRIDGFISGTSKVGPWICFRRMDRLTASNTLYVVAFRENCESLCQKHLALQLIGSRVAEQLDRMGRLYADGLLKFEPGDLHQLRVTMPHHLCPLSARYKEAISTLLAGNEEEARRRADLALTL